VVMAEVMAEEVTEVITAEVTEVITAEVTEVIKVEVTEVGAMAEIMGTDIRNVVITQ